jgi:hypothetical protein
MPMHQTNTSSAALVLIFQILFFFSGITASAQHVLQDVREVDLASTRVPLGERWYFFESQLLTPLEASLSTGKLEDLPKTWNESSENRSGIGYGTYQLRLLLPSEAKNLAVEIPQIYSSYALWINNQLIASNGTVGISPETSKPQWLPQTVSFTNPGDTVWVTLQVSNFQHHKGGVKDNIYLGSAELLQRHRSMATSSNVIESAALALIGFAFLLTYLLKARKAVVIYFSLLCLTWALRVGFSNLYIFISYMPDFNWYAMVKIEYCTLFFTQIWAILFLSRVFPKEQNKILKYVLVGSNSFFLAYTLLAPPVAFTHWIPVYLTFIGFLLLYGIVLVLRAWVNERAGSTYLTFSILLAILLFGYDVFSYEGLFAYNPIIFSAGYISIFSLMGVVLLVHLGVIKSKGESSNRLTYQDLFKEPVPKEKVIK